MRRLALIVPTLFVLLVAAIVILVSVAGASGPNPPTPRVAKLERQVQSLQRQLANTQALALGTAQQVQTSHDAFDRIDQQVAYLTERVSWLEARVDKLEKK